MNAPVHAVPDALAWRPESVALCPPLGLELDMAGLAPVLALGAWFKNAPCLLRDGDAVFAENLGDLDNADACRRLDVAVEHLLALDPRAPFAVAHDLHPDFHSTRVAVASAARLGVPAVPVQHHHAHISAVLAEHGRGNAPVLGLALDGVGLGTDGHAWGGELLRVAGGEFERLGALRPVLLPGGDRAAREPWRMAASLLHAAGRGGEIAARFPQQPAASMIAHVLARPTLCPPTTSMGRHFDAAAGLLGVCEVMRVEAEAAIALERLATEVGAGEVSEGDWSVARVDDGTLQLDLHPLLGRLADERDAARGAARFHATLVAALADWLRRAADETGLDTVVLSGGCFHNRLLAAGLETALPACGLTVLGARRLSPGDGGLALGQAWVALQRHLAT